MDCIVHGVAKSRTRLSDFPFQQMFIYLYKVETLGWGRVDSDSVACGARNPYVLPTYETTRLPLAGSVTAAAAPSGSGPGCVTSSPGLSQGPQVGSEGTVSRAEMWWLQSLAASKPVLEQFLLI